MNWYLVSHLSILFRGVSGLVMEEDVEDILLEGVSIIKVCTCKCSCSFLTI